MTTKNILILGAGMIGSAMAYDLARRPGVAVTIADVRKEALALAQAGAPGSRSIEADLADPDTLTALARSYDVVVGALSSVLGLQTLRALIEAGTPAVDVSFMADDPHALDALAKERGTCVVVDCGVAPGSSNMLVGRAVSTLASTESIEVYVGGLPEVRSWPFDYKAPFAPYDVIEEYVRPARFIENGKLVVKEALTEAELLELPGVGSVEAFNTDGLRSFLRSFPNVPWMKEKTLRWPGHVGLMRVLRAAGFFDDTPIVVDGARVSPRALTSALLFPRWKYAPGEVDITVMHIAVTGTRKEGGRVRLEWDLFDRADAESGLRSMSRTTAFPATAVAALLADGAYDVPGVHPPEDLAAVPGLVERVMADLAARGIRFDHRAVALST